MSGMLFGKPPYGVGVDGTVNFGMLSSLQVGRLGKKGSNAQYTEKKLRQQLALTHKQSEIILPWV